MTACRAQDANSCPCAGPSAALPQVRSFGRADPNVRAMSHCRCGTICINRRQRCQYKGELGHQEVELMWFVQPAQDYNVLLRGEASAVLGSGAYGDLRLHRLYGLSRYETVD